MIGVVVAALRQIRRTADGHEAGDDQFWRAVVKRRDAGVCQSLDAEFVYHVGVAVLLQAEKAEAGITDPRLVDQSRRDRPRPVECEMLRALQLIAAEAGHVAGRTERVGDRIELRAVGELIRTEQIHVVAQLVINSNRPLIDAETPCAGGYEVVRARGVRIRIEREQPHALRVPSVLRNLVVGERLVVVERIADDYEIAVVVSDVTEISLPHRQRRHVGQPRLLLASSLPFVTGEEERPVLADRASEHTSELVAAETGFLRSEEVARVEDRVAVKFKRRAVKIVRARFGRDDDLPARLTPILGAVSP